MKAYQLYFDEDKEYSATLINNTDLFNRGIDTDGYDYRIVINMWNIYWFQFSFIILVIVF
jgi:hypothetical protein